MDKRVSKGRYGDTHYVQITTPRGAAEPAVPKDVWIDVVIGKSVDVLVCPGVLGCPYPATPLDRGPYLDVLRLPGLRPASSLLHC